jgi:tRNA threonylcarbamoyladenosine biosynthesis protein TsaB
MPTLLLIETATEVCSVALARDGEVLACVEDLACASHVAALTPQIGTCLAQAGLSPDQIDAVGLSQGPGSYTSLRVGASVAKGWCYAIGRPLLALDTLEGLAEGLRNQHPIPPDAALLPMLDARRQEVWLAAYDAQLGLLAEAQPLILENNSFDVWLEKTLPKHITKKFFVAGNGIQKFLNGHFEKKAEHPTLEKASARYLVAAAEKKYAQKDFANLAYFEPFYMKPPNITTPSKALF